MITLLATYIFYTSKKKHNARELICAFTATLLLDGIMILAIRQ